MSRALGPLAAAVAASLLLSGGVAGQAGGETGDAPPPAGGAVSPDSAARLRAALERPPGDHPFDAIDAIGLPFRVVTFPLTLAGRGIAAGLDLVTAGGPPPFYLRALEEARAWGLRPDVGSIGPRSGPALSLALLRWEPAYLATAVSSRGSQDHRAGLRLSEEDASARLGFGFHRDAEPRFWGIGARSAEAARTDFRHDRLEASLGGRWSVLPWLELRLDGGWEENRVGGGSDAESPDIGERFPEDELFGLGETTRFVRAGPGFEVDLTERTGFQRRGVVVAASAAVYRGTGSTEADFHRLRASVAGFLPVDGRQALALQAASELNRGDEGAGVPFTHLAELGDEPGARAYPDGRFRDRDLLTLTAEWRYEVWRELQGRVRAEGFVFFEEGAVAHDLGSLEGADFRPSWGGGLRLVGGRGVLGRAFVAGGEEGARLQLDTSAAF